MNYMIDAVIVGETYWNPEGTTLTVCVLTLRNGFTVTGESAAASPSNFDIEIGKKIARGNAREKIWALEGYLLREKLYAGDAISQAVYAFAGELTCSPDPITFGASIEAGPAAELVAKFLDRWNSRG